jgi:uncharacterized protein YbjT (DUF2867 family)
VSRTVLVLGGTGTLGVTVTRHLAEKGHAVRVLTRNPDKAKRLFEDLVQLIEGDPTKREQVKRAMSGCDAVHISLPTDSELTAAQHVIDMASSKDLQLISYVSGTSVREENRWSKLIETKARVETMLRHSGIPHIVFCPTWVMEVLHKFVRGDKAAVISSKNPMGIHFFAANDFGQMVAKAFEDERTFGKRLFIHGPDSITLLDALKTLLDACYPQVKVAHLKLWQARLIARITGKMDSVSRLIQYFEKVGELGDPSEANALLGAPSTTLITWVESQKKPGD